MIPMAAEVEVVPATRKKHLRQVHCLRLHLFKWPLVLEARPAIAILAPEVQVAQQTSEIWLRRQEERAVTVAEAEHRVVDKGEM